MKWRGRNPELADNDVLPPQTTHLSKPKPEFSAIPSEVGGFGYESNMSLQAAMDHGGSADLSGGADLSRSDLDYHYQSSQSNISQIIEHVAPQAYHPPAAVQTMASAPAQAHAPAPVVQLVSPPAPEPVIHFGASIPGETIDRAGRTFTIDPYLHDMIKRKASDIHLTQNEILCMRIDGEIERVGSEPLTEALMKSLLLPIMPGDCSKSQ